MLTYELPACPHIWLFLQCIKVCHFGLPHCVFDPVLAATFSQGRSSQWGTGILEGHLPPWLCHESLHVLIVTYTICPGQQPSSPQEGRATNLPLLCNVSSTLYLLLFPAPKSCLKAGLWGCSLLSGDMLCPITFTYNIILVSGVQPGD